jgi:hypothetical protein
MIFYLNVPQFFFYNNIPVFKKKFRNVPSLGQKLTCCKSPLMAELTTTPSYGHGGSLNYAIYQQFFAFRFHVLLHGEPVLFFFFEMLINIINNNKIMIKK